MSYENLLLSQPLSQAVRKTTASVSPPLCLKVPAAVFVSVTSDNVPVWNWKVGGEEEYLKATPPSLQPSPEALHNKFGKHAHFEASK